MDVTTKELSDMLKFTPLEFETTDVFEIAKLFSR